MTKDSAKFLRVTDSSCTPESGERTHSVFLRGVLTHTVFKHGVETILPFEHAIKFMQDGFKVEETDGRTMTLPAITKDTVKAELAKDQVIANLSELNLASLKLRAGQKPGGEVYLDADDDARDDLIAFIIGEPPAAPAAAETIDGEDDLIEDEGDETGEVFVGLAGGGRSGGAGPVEITVKKAADGETERTAETITADDVGFIDGNTILPIS